MTTICSKASNELKALAKGSPYMSIAKRKPLEYKFWNMLRIMLVIYCYVERDSNKILKFHKNNSSYFEISAPLF